MNFLVHKNPAHQGVRKRWKFQNFLGICLQVDPQKSKPCMLTKPITTKHTSAGCLFSVSNNHPFCNLIWHLRSLSPSPVCLVVLVHLGEKWIFRRSFHLGLHCRSCSLMLLWLRLLNWNQRRQSRRKTTRRGELAEASKDHGASYLFMYWWTEPINFCSTKMCVVILIVFIISNKEQIAQESLVLLDRKLTVVTIEAHRRV